MQDKDYRWILWFIVFMTLAIYNDVSRTRDVVNKIAKKLEIKIEDLSNE